MRMVISSTWYGGAEGGEGREENGEGERRGRVKIKGVRGKRRGAPPQLRNIACLFLSKEHVLVLKEYLSPLHSLCQRIT